MRALQKWFTGSSMSWAGLRWGAAGVSLAVHGAAASLAWVMIETEPAQVIQAFTVEIVSMDQTQGAVSQKKMASTSVAVHRAEKELKTDLSRGRVSASSAPKQQVQQKPQQKPRQNPLRKFKKMEIEIARATPVPEHNLPIMKSPVVAFPPPPLKPPMPKKRQQKEKMPAAVVKPPVDHKSKNQKETKAVKLAHRSPSSSPPSQGGTGAGKVPAKGEAVPMTAASYTLGALGNKPPEYPERARRNEFEGRIVLRVRVSSVGKSETVTIKTSSGYQLLDEAARTAVKAWRFIPAKKAGIAVASTIDVPIMFRLTETR